MDQIKIGKFISEMRKAQSLTQRQLADALNISDKTVSKWETGRGLPEVALMLPLCELLHINVNELLSGERLTAADYSQKAEENMMKLMKEKEESKKKIVLSLVICMIVIVAAVTLVVVAGYAEMGTLARVALIAVALVIVVAGIGVACVLDYDAGAYECKHCGERFVPDLKSYVMGAHTITRRQLTCPHCGKRSYCKRRLSK